MDSRVTSDMYQEHRDFTGTPLLEGTRAVVQNPNEIVTARVHY
jgi:hypothetical protein